jgi:glutamate N-acetyltransferase / amino-acid N-acetyltransferase
MLNVDETIQSVKGFRVVGVHAGMKKNGNPDLALIVSDRDCVTAGIFTKNEAKAAPILVSQEHLTKNPSSIRAVAINTTSANAMTGRVGIENSRTMARFVAQQANIQNEQVLVMSTGVIGTHLPMTLIEKGIEMAYPLLGNDWHSTARAIMTTDTRPKTASIKVQTIEGEYTIAGISKGAGMIAPNMATMLSVIVTDAKLELAQANVALHFAANKSFNRIVVDGDTSTNDCVFLMTNGASGVYLKTQADILQFYQALTSVAQQLAQAIVRDGEGATKFITLHVTGATDEGSAYKVANTIATSPLVKTAFFGNDANWGRIIAAAGRAGVPFNPDTTQLWISPGEELFEDDKGLLLFQNGMPTTYSEAEATRIFSEESVYVSLDLGLGTSESMVWTCDLSDQYVAINGDYRS